MGYIYKISNTIDNRVYIGSTVNLNKRWNEHKRKLKNNEHENIHLQRFVNKYSINVLIFDIIEEVENKIILLQREQHYLNIIENKFNIAESSSAPMMGKTHTPESIEKIANHSRGKNNPMYGKKRPKELIDLLMYHNKYRIKTNEEKVIRLISKPNRIELIIEKNNMKIYCFSIAHASRIIDVSNQSISYALNNNGISKGWKISKSNINFYKKSILYENIKLFDNNGDPQPELINKLKSLLIL